MVREVNCWLCKHEDVSSDPQLPLESETWLGVSIILVLGWSGHVDPGMLVGSQSSIISELQVQ